MLAAQSMGSHGGHQGLPFGYDPNGLHGIGLPDFITPGPPPGPPLLNQLENQDLDSFFTDFDTGVTNNNGAGHDGSISHFSNGLDHAPNWMMPPTLVASDTSLRPPTGNEWQSLPMSDFSFRNDLSLGHISTPSGFDSGSQVHHFTGNNQYTPNMLHHLHNAAQSMQSSTYSNNWQQSLPQQAVPQMQHQTNRPTMRFGSDQRFQLSGYSAPDGQYDPDATPNLDWLEANSSAANTQPNTRPSTQPSSPYTTKKRKLSDYVDDSRRNGYIPAANGIINNMKKSPPIAAIREGKKLSIKQEQMTATPLSPTPIPVHSGTLMHDAEEDDEDDADFDDDDSAPQSRPQTSSSSFAWPANKPKPPKNSKPLPPPKPIRSRKKSSASSTPVRLKLKTGRSSTGGTPASRTPLTADQKKANHTNSEQRRRDATARSYAELYDLVPELDQKGKQSTMKKLEIVVAKVSTVKQRVAQLRALLGMDVEDESSGVVAHQALSTFDRPTTSSALDMGTFPAPDLRSWNPR